MANNRNNGYGYGYGYGYGNNPEEENDSVNKSKYLRKPGEKKQSKYIRNKYEGKPKSKYARDRFEPREHHYNLARHYRDGVLITEDTAEEVEAVELEETAEVSENTEVIAQNEEVKETEKETVTGDKSEIISDNFEEGDDGEEELMSFEDFETESKPEEREHPKGDVASLFTHSKMSKETTVVQVKSEEEARRNLIIMTVVVMTVLTAIAVALQFATIRIANYMPRMINFELSLIPEFIASLAYGPVFGLIVLVLKTIINVLINLSISNVSFGSILSGLILDSLFIFIGGIFYSRQMYDLNPKKSRKPQNRDMRRRRIFIGGLIATAITTFVSFFLTRYVSFPLLMWQYSSRGMNEFFIIRQYQGALDYLNSALPETFSSPITQITSLSHAILFYNVPITVIKLLIVTVVSTIVYPIISPYIHFRKKTK